MGMILRLTLTSALISLTLSGCSSKTSAPIRKASSVSNETHRSLPATTQATTSVSDRADTWTPIPTPPDSISLEPTTYDNSTYKTPSSKTIPKPVSHANSKTSIVSAMPNRNYSEIPKGSFSGDFYTVNHGDTLFYIAWITGNDYRTLAEKNNIAEPFHLAVGQVLKVSGGINNTQTIVGSITNKNKTVNPYLHDKQRAETTSTRTIGSTITPAKSKELSSIPVKNKEAPASETTSTTTVSTNTGVSASGTTIINRNNGNNKSSLGGLTTTSANIVWRWPAEGKIIDDFSTSGEGNKGIDIAGSRGQSVVSAADGRVVYAGNALRGYGNLIIIKHNDDYLSAYAHNDSMLVSEQQEVKAGQKIATMGSSGASSVRLHFEVRYKGRSVNPLQYLPQR